jgi:hypothetical protein
VRRTKVVDKYLLTMQSVNRTLHHTTEFEHQVTHHQLLQAQN